MMASSTPCCKKTDRLALQIVRCLILAVLFVLQPRQRRAEGIHVKSAELIPSEAGYSLEANYEITLSHTLEEALLRGLALPFVIDFELTYPRWWTFGLWNRTVVEIPPAASAVLQRAHPPVPRFFRQPESELRYPGGGARCDRPGAPARRVYTKEDVDTAASTSPPCDCAWTPRCCPSHCRSTRSARATGICRRIGTGGRSGHDSSLLYSTHVRKSLLSRGMKYLIALILLLGAVMLYLLSSASSNTPMFARDLPLLLFCGVAVVLGADGAGWLPAAGVAPAAGGGSVRLEADVAPGAVVLAGGGAAGCAGVRRVGAVPEQEHRVLVRRARGQGAGGGSEPGPYHPGQHAQGA